MTTDPAQLDIFDTLDPRTHARREDPDTSHEAARRLSDKRTMMRALLERFAQYPYTSEEAALYCGYDPWQASKRVSDLVRLGLIEDTDDRRPGRSGRDQIVRRITEAGIRALS